MDPHQHQNDFFFPPFWGEDRPVAASPEYSDNNLFFPPQMDLAAAAGVQSSDGMQGMHRATLRLSPELSNAPMRGPILSPSGHQGHSGFNHGMAPSYLMKTHHHHHPHHPHMIMSYGATGAAAPALMSVSKASSSASSPVQTHLFPMVPSFGEDAPSTDATPESSDVEGESSNGRRTKKSKRVKKMISEDIHADHNEQARVFPVLMDSLRRKLLMESPDGTISESNAVSALIVEFTKNTFARKYEFPPECEQWLKRAAEDVNEHRMAAKGLKKKKSMDYIASPTGERTFICSYCIEQGEQKSFKTQEGLNLHVRNKHEKDKQWVCHAPGCNVSFVRQADLRMHLIRMHAPVRPFPCGVPFCLKSFAGISELRRHVKVDHYKHIRDLCNPVMRSSDAPPLQ